MSNGITITVRKMVNDKMTDKMVHIFIDDKDRQDQEAISQAIEKALKEFLE